MKITVNLALLAALGLFTAQMAQAQNINVSTGLDGSNALLGAGGLSDAHWSVPPQAGGPAIAAQTVYPNNADWYGGWLANGPDSAWIARDASVSNNGAAPYTFSMTFDLTGRDLSTASLTGAWAIDDSGDLALNGNAIGTLGSGAWGGLTPFSVATGSPFFNQGLNTLSITITSDDFFLEAARLQGTVSARNSNSSVPEPGSVALLVGMMTAGAGVLRRRRK